MIPLFPFMVGLLPVQSQPTPDFLPAIVGAAMERYHVPGAVVAIVRNDTVVALSGFGFARLEDSVPADPTRSIYRLASVAKLFVATTVLEEVGKGALALDRDVSGYVPEVPIPATFPGIITLRHLLTHTAGFDERVIGYAARTREEMIPLGRYLARRLPDRGWPPGLLVAYSNHGMALAAYATESTAKLPFRALAARDLFEPLGMTRTYYVRPPNDSLLADLAPGYRCGASGCERAPVVWSHAYPVGLAFSTALDMARFIRAELANGTIDGRQVLTARTVAESQARQFGHDPRLPGMGFGFFEQERRGARLLTHAGGAPGAATVLALAPAQRVGVFIATNAGEAGFTRAVLDGVLHTLLPLSDPKSLVATGSVAEYAGSYRLTRYSHHTIERFPGVFAFTFRARAVGDTLILPLGASKRRFVRVDSLLLRDLESDTKLVLRRDPRGRITHLFTGLPSGGAELPAAFERVPWYEGAWFLNEYVSWLLLLLPLVLALWGLVSAGRWFWRRRRPSPNPSPPGRSRLARAAILSVVALEVMFLVFGFGFVARSTRQLGRTEGIAFGMSEADVLLLRLAWPVAAVAVVIVALAALAWRRRWWDGFGRICYSVLALCSAAVAHFLFWFGYIPGRW